MIRAAMSMAELKYAGGMLADSGTPCCRRYAAVLHPDMARRRTL